MYPPPFHPIGVTSLFYWSPGAGQPAIGVLSDGKRFWQAVQIIFFHFFLDKKVEQKIKPSEKWAKNAVHGLNPAKLAGSSCGCEERTGSNSRRLLNGHARHFLNAIFPRAFPAPCGGPFYVMEIYLAGPPSGAGRATGMGILFTDGVEQNVAPLGLDFLSCSIPMG